MEMALEMAALLCDGLDTLMTGLWSLDCVHWGFLDTRPFVNFWIHGHNSTELHIRRMRQIEKLISAEVMIALRCVNSMAGAL